MSFNEEIKEIGLETGKMMATFAKNYTISLVSHSISGLMDDVLAEVLSELKDAAVTITKGPRGGQGEDGGEEKAKEVERIVGAKISQHSKETDVDTSVYTAYHISSVVIDPENSSIQQFQTRYRNMFKLNKDMSKNADLKEEYSKFKFPPKKMFGNKSDKFVEQRQQELNEWLSHVVQTPKIATSPVFLKAFKLQDDPDAQFDHDVFVDAFLSTCAERNTWISTDPADFEDEGTGLVLLMIDVAEKTVMPKIEEKIAKLPTGQSVARRSARSALAKAVGKGVHTAWDAAQDGFTKGKDAMREQVAKGADQLKAVIKQVLGKLTPILVEKLAKKNNPPPKEEKQPFKPSLDQLPYGKRLLAAVEREAEVTEHLLKLKDEIRETFRVKARMEREADWFISDIPDYDLRHVFYMVKDLVSGLLDLWLNMVDSVVQGVSLFFRTKDQIEAKFVELAAQGADGAKAAAKAEIDKVSAHLRDELRGFGLDVCSKFYKEQRDLRYNLRALSKDASAGLRDTVMGVPNALLNFVAKFRLNWINNLSSAFDKGTDADTVRGEVRRIFLVSGLESFNDFFGESWIVMTTAVSDAARMTLVEKLADSAKPIVEGVLEQLQSINPVPGFDIASLTDTAVDKLLDTIAGSALAFAQRKLEKAVFTEDNA